MSYSQHVVRHIAHKVNRERILQAEELCQEQRGSDGLREETVMFRLCDRLSGKLVTHKYCVLLFSRTVSGSFI
jgi:hypothetical protein